MTKHAGLLSVLGLGALIGQKVTAQQVDWPSPRLRRPRLAVLDPYFTADYGSLLPGEARDVTIRVLGASPPATLRLRGWNVVDRVLPLRPPSKT